MGLVEPELMCFGDGVQRTKLSSAPVRQFVTRDQVQGRRAAVTAIPRVGQFATSSHHGRSWRRELDAWSGRHSDLLAAAVAAVGFLCRAWLAHATFFNPDEAWHFSVANQDSIRQAYQASLTLFHPPLLILVLYFSRSLGTSDLTLRLPCVIAGAVLCWLYYQSLKVILGQTVAWTKPYNLSAARVRRQM